MLVGGRGRILLGRSNWFLLGRRSGMLVGGRGRILLGRSNWFLPGRRNRFLPGRRGRILPGRRDRILPGRRCAGRTRHARVPVSTSAPQAASSFCFACSNSVSLIAPEVFRSASLLSWSTVPPPRASEEPAVCRT